MLNKNIQIWDTTRHHKIPYPGNKSMIIPCSNHDKSMVKKQGLTLIRLGFLRVVFSGGGRGGGSILNYYQYNFIPLLNNLFKVC